MKNSNSPVNSSESINTKRKQKNSKLAVIGIFLLVVFTFGQYLAMYLPAFNGVQPQLFFLFISMLWTALLGLFGARFVGRKKRYAFIAGLIIGGAAFAGALLLGDLRSDKNTGPWSQSQLQQSFMQGLSKNQCLLKSSSFLKRCDSAACLKTMNAVTTDCISVASGPSPEFCLSLAAEQQLVCGLTETDNTAGNSKENSLCLLQQKLHSRFCR